MKIFATASVPPERRTAHWNEVYEQFAPCSISPAQDDPFRAELRLGGVGPLDIALVRSDGAEVERTAQHAAKAVDRKLGIMILLQGAGVYAHCGHEGALSAGDIVINDNTRPLIHRSSEPIVGVTVRADDAALRARMPFIDDVCGWRLPANVGLTRAASAMAKCLADQADQDFANEYGMAMAGHFVDVLATAYAMARQNTAPQSSVVSMRKALVRQHIEARLGDPALGPQSIAKSLRISPRYLRMLMAEEGETASALILRRRLEECAKQLASPLWRGRTITEIAFNWGFNSTAHFARVFRNQFGVSPRQYRQAAADNNPSLYA